MPRPPPRKGPQQKRRLPQQLGRHLVSIPNGQGCFPCPLYHPPLFLRMRLRPLPRSTKGTQKSTRNQMVRRRKRRLPHTPRNIQLCLMIIPQHMKCPRKSKSRMLTSQLAEQAHQPPEDQPPKRVR